MQLKLNYPAKLIAKLGSLAGLILFFALTIRFFVQLNLGGTSNRLNFVALNSIAHRTANEKGIAFVNILVISVTLIVLLIRKVRRRRTRAH